MLLTQKTNTLSMNNTHLIQLGQYDMPKAIESRTDNFVGYGEDNNYYQYLIDTYIESPTHHSITNGVVNMIYGKGLDASDSSKKPDEYAQMKTIFKPDELRRVVQDLKLLGEGAFQIIYKGGKISEAKHFPRQTLRPEKANEKGDIEAYYYSADWSKHRKRDKLTRMPVFSNDGKPKTQSEIFIVRRYVTGYHYVSPPDYVGAIGYATLEAEISDYLINDVQCGFSGTKIINFNNGVPDREKQLEVKSDVMQKLTGSKGEKVLISFNSTPEAKTTIDDIPLNDAPAHYQYLSDECARKLMIGHRITSPLLLGIRDGNNSLGSNADEIKHAFQLFDNVVIKPYQHLLTDAIDTILSVNNVALKTYFKTLEPIEFQDTAQIVSKEEKEEETGIKMSEDMTCCSEDEAFTDEHGDILFEGLKGEIVNDEWEVVEEREYSEDNEVFEQWANSDSEQKLYQVASQPSGFSYLDKSSYKVRYKYAVGSRKAKKAGNTSRKFCTDMMAASRAGVVYRLEDIDRASRDLNFKAAELPMHNNQKFDLFKHKGGIYCRHIWKEVLYKLKVGKEVSEDITDYKKAKDIPASYKPSPRGSKQAKVAPINSPTKGAYPS